MTETITQPKPPETPEATPAVQTEEVGSHEPQNDEEKAEVKEAAVDLKEAAATQTAEQTLQDHAAEGDTQTEKSEKQIKREQQEALLEWLKGQDKTMILASIVMGKVFLGLRGDTTLMFMKMFGDMRKNKKEAA